MHQRCDLHFTSPEGSTLLAYFNVFANFETIKKTFAKNLSAHIIFELDTTFVPNLTFSGLHSPRISCGEKTVTRSPTKLISRSVNLSAAQRY